MLYAQQRNAKRLVAPYRQRVLILAALLAAFALRLFRLGATSLWYDETVSVSLAKKPVTALIAHTSGDIHPPGYYLLLHLWRQLTEPVQGSEGFEFLYAWPSLWCGILTIAILYALARSLYCPPVALLALWLAAFHPFQIWYSQEVRMYTLGALLGLLALWLLHRFLAAQQPVQWLPAYVVTATLGLYTLYYYLLLLVALNLLALFFLVRNRATWPRLWQWLGAQLAVLALWSPWLPIFWRQMVDPPVPPWRPAWQGWQDLLQAASESLSTLLAGQSAPAGLQWFWALLALGATVLALYVKWRPALVTARSWPSETGQPCYSEKVKASLYLALPVYVFTPMLLLYGLSLAVTPLYHVRYLFIYAPPFIILMAGALWSLRLWGRPLFFAMLLGLTFIDVWSLQQLWWNPANQRDDHRSAVAYLADQWRPGDRILVNAGWAYTVLETYWPSEIHEPLGAAPPALGPGVRLVDLAPSTVNENPALLLLEETPQLVRTGSVDGPASLGWGAADADFFAIREEDAYMALAVLARDARRIWHYRLYDTVSDPNGSIRSWLETHATLRSERPIAGRDFGLLQLYEMSSTDSQFTDQPAYTPRNDWFGDMVQLSGAAIPAQVHAGSYLYTRTRWRPNAALQEQASDLSLSLRLYNKQGILLAQRDEGSAITAASWAPGASYEVPLALPVPLATPPGEYDVVLVVYWQQTGEPLPLITASENHGSGDMAALATIDVLLPTQVPALGGSIAHFDYIDLLAAQPAPTVIQASATQESMLAVKLIWRPNENIYRDTYLAVLDLRTKDGEVIQTWEDVLGGWSYPSSQWPPALPVLEHRRLPLAPGTPKGEYQLTLRVMRHSDRQLIPSRRAGWLWSAPAIMIGQVTVE